MKMIKYNLCTYTGQTLNSYYKSNIVNITDIF